MNKKIMLSAVAPSNRITLGNYLGAIKQWVKMQQDYDCLFFVVDLHAITEKQDPLKLKERTLQLLALYLACGIDPKHCTLFIQSHVPAHAELSWILTCYTHMGELSRMTQYKDKSQKHHEVIPAGLFLYPVLMASDILLYQTDLVPVGADQKQHIELTRDLATRMNHLYCSKEETPLFKLPTPFIPTQGARIMSLQDPTRKMSKSDSDPLASIFLDDSDAEIEKKFKKAVTDSGSTITASPEQAGVHNLLTIQSVLTGKTLDELVSAYAGRMYGHLKLDTAKIVTEAIRPIRDRAHELLAHPSYLNEVLREGAAKASQRAEQTLRHVKQKIGFTLP